MLKVESVKLTFKKGTIEADMEELFKLREEIDKLLGEAKNKGEIFTKLKEIKEQLDRQKESRPNYVPMYPPIWVDPSPAWPLTTPHTPTVPFEPYVGDPIYPYWKVGDIVCLSAANSSVSLSPHNPT